MLTRRSFLQTAAGVAAAPHLNAAPQRPNIVVMMADDMGFSDIGCYGSEIRTPNLDRLAARGVRFTQFCNTARCCPTRASLLTGLYAHQAGIGHMMEPKPFPAYAGDLGRRCVTIAEALRPAGYRTAMSGKWHVTPVNNSKHNWPLQRGFERYFGIIHGAASFFNPVSLTRDNEFIRPEGKDFYLTDAIAQNASQYVRDFAAKPDPFFLYVAFTSPHWPMHALESDVDRYKGRYREGWDTLREERLKRMVATGIVERRWGLTPRDSRVPAWAEAPNKEWQQRRMEVYAAMIDRMDQGIGRILNALEETKALDNTLILFLSDNGGCAEELGPNSRGLHIPATTRDGRPVRVGNRPDIMPGHDDDFQSYGLNWANASNTPFRLYKHWVHEGGISTPLIAHWPSRLKGPGRLSRDPGHLIDIMATCVDVAGLRYPQSHNGESITPLEGRSLAPVMLSGKREPHPHIFWEHEGNRAVRSGKWKLVSRHPDKWELYDLEADRTEMHDLSRQHPGRATDLEQVYRGWADKVGVQPWEVIQKS